MDIKSRLKFVLSALVFLTVSKVCLAQIPNGNFESWATIKNYSEPKSWASLNAATSRFNIFTCSKLGNLSQGFSVSLYSENINGKIFPGIIVSGRIDTTTYKPLSGFGFTLRPVELTGRRQYMGYEYDNGFIAAYLTKWNNVTNIRDTIAIAYEELSGMLHVWSDFKIPFNYRSLLNPDTCIIILSSSGNSPKTNSFLYIDDLSFDNGVKPPPTRKPVTDLLIYPNPVNDYLFIEKGKLKLSIRQIIITDVLGRTVLQLDVSVAELLKINISNLPAGPYYLSIVSDKTLIKSKIIKQ